MNDDEWTHETVPIASLTRDRELQSREVTDADTVASYKELLERGVKLPRPAVYRDGELLHLADGQHTVTAEDERGAISVDVKVRPGTREDAILHSAAANATHGLPRTNKDKRRAVRMVLELRPDWTNGVVAEHCSVSDRLVTDVRKALDLPHTPTRVDRRGRTMNVERIGKRGAVADRAPASAESADTIAPTPAPSSTVRLSDDFTAGGVNDASRESEAACDARLPHPHDLDALLIVRKGDEESDDLESLADDEETDGSGDVDDDSSDADQDRDEHAYGSSDDARDAPAPTRDDEAAIVKDVPSHVKIAYEFGQWSEDMLRVGDAAELLGLTTTPGQSIAVDADAARGYAAARLAELRERYSDANVARALAAIDRYNEMWATPAFKKFVSGLTRERQISLAGPLRRSSSKR